LLWDFAKGERVDEKQRITLETHRSDRAGWLRAAILGADDGVVSTASLMIGVAASTASRANVLVAGVAGLVAGAMSMAAGEYVSVSSQRDAEEADSEIEKGELAANPRGELRELAQIYQRRGLEPGLAMQVAEQLSHRDRLGAHLRDELGLIPETRARPVQAALVSAGSFAMAAVVPIVALLIAPERLRIAIMAGAALCSLAVLGALGGRMGGAPPGRGAARVMIGGGLAMAVTATIGELLHVAGL
jgi:vacuolar iron transporter family protein